MEGGAAPTTNNNQSAFSGGICMTINMHGDLDWFTKARFGMFITWGLYALPARHEWVKKRECLSDAAYDRYFEHFDPDLYDPQVWAAEAKNAGMQYYVATTKHHEGFCLWDSPLTDYKATNTPARRDLLTPMVSAFREAGLRTGFYYSLIDWHHPEFPIDGYHPMRNDEAYRRSQQHRNIRTYTDYLHGQVRELLTRFGTIDILWLDFSYSFEDWGWAKGKGKQDWQAEELMNLIRSIQPHVLVNDRMEIGGDIITPEQYQPRYGFEFNDGPQAWEACQTMNGSWGYDRDNLDWKPAEMLIKILIDSVSKNGNLLLNVGPNARGELPGRTIDRLREIGCWMRLHSRAIYNCGGSAYTPPPDCRYTQNGRRIFLHIFSWPMRHLHLDGLAGQVEYAQFLHDGSEVKYFEKDPNHPSLPITVPVAPGALVLELPIQKPDVCVPVIEIFLKD